ncbi:UNVERIFIED_ORG: type II toxin-antitoxin system MqsA family antitoxin (plasmid) [Shinella sp. XGS7]|nr:type II toxin-antitoxin system MqsA family antitoxin [Shinella sp. XGS7]
MSDSALCPVCGIGHASELVEQVESQYKGQSTLLPVYMLACDHCGSETAGAVETKKSRRALMAWRKQIDSLLTGEQIVALRQKLGLTQAQAARLFGGGPVAFSKYENDDVAQSESMDTLLRLVLRSRAAFDALVEEKGMQAELATTGSAVLTSLKLVTSSTFRVQQQGATDKSVRYDPKEFRSRQGLQTEELRWTQK